MKKTLLFAALLLSFTTFAQTAKHVPYASPSVGWTPAQDLTYSFEAGIWGTSSPTSFAITFDAGKNISVQPAGDFSKWIGLKAYYDMKDLDKISYYTYAAMKMKMDNSKESIIEFGFNPCYTLSKRWLASITLGNQITSTSQWNMFISGGFLYLFK